MADIQQVLDQVAALPTASKPYINPYAGHRALSDHEQELLGEYARLADTVRRVAALSTLLSSSTAHASLLTQLRVLERKMGLVLTLYKASVWATVQEQAEMAEAEAMAAAGAEMGAYAGVDMGMYADAAAAAAGYLYGGEESGDGDDTVVMRQPEYY
ncbi:uncharacterized protein SRS1_14582 [Sporisorium reilianum f. sp. reilianum]|uniref:DASH complex subunit DAD3 n=1 Tax=Sporisorium reilianum f. sp. reilianum TaxID=72559 RepID=A0A2N8UGH3_9BASI|nr:uncharacterized protein SRS1_14582 [Sporisorium reilianum f. sp. reilianum]